MIYYYKSESNFLNRISRYTAWRYNSQLEKTDPELYNKLQNQDGRLTGLENFEVLKPLPDAINEFGKEIGGSKLNYALFYLTDPKRILIVSFTDIEGEKYGIFYLGKTAVAMGRLINKVEATIPFIKQALERDKDFMR